MRSGFVGLSVSALCLVVLACGVLLQTTSGASPNCADAKKSPQKKDVSDASGPNAPCLRCHDGFMSESLSVTHLKEGTRCAECHGPSVAHMTQDPGVIRPDILFGREEVKPFCQRCHETPHRSEARVTAWLKERKGQTLPSGRPADHAAVCTDCHGEHVVPLATGQPGQMAAGRQGPVTLFNGKDLSGWKSEGGAIWKVDNGMLVGTQGPDNAPGDLLTEATYRNFELTVTYRVVWPANTGVWFRYQAPDKAYQADILEYPKPIAYSGTLYCPGKLFLAIQDDKDLVNREGWNTVTVRAEDDHLRIWLNGMPVADVRDSTSDCGRIGFQVHAGKEFGPMKITVRRVLLQQLQ